MNLDIAVELCKLYEGFSSKPYLCPAGVATIGYGNTYYGHKQPVTMKDVSITKEEAEKLLLEEINKVALGVLRLCPILISHNNKLNAIVDFSYNLGLGRLQTSTLRRKINQESWEEAAKELLKWNRGGGRILPGLVKRRQSEAALMV